MLAYTISLKVGIGHLAVEVRKTVMVDAKDPFLHLQTPTDNLLRQAVRDLMIEKEKKSDE